METKENSKFVLSQEEYEYHMKRTRNIAMEALSEIENEIEKYTHPESRDSYIPCLEALLNLLLLVSDSDKGKKIFIRLLEYAKHERPKLAGEYWELFDDRDNLFKRRYYNLYIN